MDIKGQALGVPIYELLGGAVRDSIPLYTHFQYARSVEEMVANACAEVERGSRAIKTDPFMAAGGLSNVHYVDGQIDRAIENTGVATIEGIRKAVGPDIEVLIDAHALYKVPTAIRLANHLAPYAITWFEEPCPPESYDALEQALTDTARSTVACIDTQVILRPAAELADLFALDLRRGANGAHPSIDVNRGHRSGAIHERVENSAFHGGLDLCAREPFSGGRKRLGVEGVGIASAFGQVGAEDRRPVLGRGQVDENDLTETALTDLFGRELAHIIGRGNDEHVLLLAHPIEQEADRAGSLPSVGAGGGLEPAHGLFELRGARDAFERGRNTHSAADAHGRRANHAATLTHDAPKSRSSNGRPSTAAATFLHKSFPQPGSPTRSNPLWGSTPKACAAGVKVAAASCSSCLRWA